MNNQKNGLTIVILTFDRKKGLNILLNSILKQNFKNLPYEIILGNNYPTQFIKKSSLTSLGKTLKKIADIKIFNASHSYDCQLRYQLATLAKYNKIMFLDDDIQLLDPNFIFDMYTAHEKLADNDILSAHCKLWTKYNKQGFEEVFMNYREPKIKQITKCDVIGPGICIFAKKLALKDKVLTMSLDYPGSYDWAFTLISQTKYNSQCFYFPCFGKINFNDDKKRHALSMQNNFLKNKFEVHKHFWQNGYQPVLERLSQNATEQTSPELFALKNLNPVSHDW